MTSSESWLKMLGCSVLLTCLMTMTLFHCTIESQHLTQDKLEHVKSTVMESHGGQRGLVAKKASRSVSNKMLFMDRLLRLQNEVNDTKRKRSFPVSNTPLDRLSISNMEPKSNKQRCSRKVVELPRQRVTVPIDRIGVGRLPNTRG